MPNVFDTVFETHSLREGPWVCYTRRRHASRSDVEFWVARRRLKKSISKDGRQIFGDELDTGRAYELS
jgi:hypothetical protein